MNKNKTLMAIIGGVFALIMYLSIFTLLVIDWREIFDNNEMIGEIMHILKTIFIVLICVFVSNKFYKWYLSNLK